MVTEELNKSIEALINEVFAEGTVEKSIEIAKDATTKADQAVSKAPKGQSDDSRGAGRPKQISDVPDKDEDGKRDGEYDGAISEASKEKDQAEIDQVSDMSQIEEKKRMGNKSKAPKMAPFKKSLSEAEYEEYQALKKAQEDAKVEELKKAEENKQEELIKSVVERTAEKVAAQYKGEVEGLKKSLAESNEMVKAMANAPRTAKSITGIEQMEKSLDTPKNEGPEQLTKSEAAELAYEAFEKGVITDEEAIEVENNGFIYDTGARKRFENYVAKKYS